MQNQLDNRLITQRKQKIYDLLSNCDNDSSRISILIDKVIELENSIEVLRQSLVEFQIKYNSLCVPLPF